MQIDDVINGLKSTGEEAQTEVAGWLEELKLRRHADEDLKEYKNSEDNCTIDVLSTKYRIEYKKDYEDAYLKNYNGYCDSTVKKIVVCDFDRSPEDLANLDHYQRRCIRHEIVHAFLDESGLQSNSQWARNEELVDWIAIQAEKIYKAFAEAKAI